jgi:hypothetical protein
MKTRLFFCAVMILLTGCAAQRNSSLRAARPPIQFHETGTATVRTNDLLAAPAASINQLLPAPGRKIIIMVHLTLEVDSNATVADRIADIAIKQGGFVVSCGLREVVIRVPTDTLEDAVGRITALGNLIDRKYTGTDITRNFRDDQIRLEEALKSRERYLELLDKAETVKDILDIERELERINRDIDRLKGRLNANSQRLEFTGITVRLRSIDRSKPGPVGFIFYKIYKGCRWLFVH